MLRSHCRSCNAPITWARTDHGKRIPLDFEPDRTGLVELTRESDSTGLPIVVVHGQPDLFAEVGRRFTSHFATCPDADSWRL